MTLDLNKPVQLTDGRPVRIICTDAEGDWPVVAFGKDAGCYSWVALFELDGTPQQGNRRLQNIPPPARFVWINVYAHGAGGGTFQSRESADLRGSCGRTHLLQVNIDTGETKVHAP